MPVARLLLLVVSVSLFQSAHAGLMKQQPEPLSDVFTLKRFAGGIGPWKWQRDDIYSLQPDGSTTYIGTTAAAGYVSSTLAALGAGDIENRELAISTDGRTIVFSHWALHAPKEAKLSSGIYRYRYGTNTEAIEPIDGQPHSRTRWPRLLPRNLLAFSVIAQDADSDAPARAAGNVLWAIRADDGTRFPLALLGAQAIHRHAFDGATKECETQVANGADINAQTYWGMTGLDLAIILDHQETAIRLLELGADPDVGVYPAFHRAVMLGRMNVVKAMLARGAAVNLQDEFGYTPLHHAVYAGRRLVNGVNLFFDGIVTPRSIMERNITTELVQLLLENGADPSLRNRSGRTAGDEATEYTPPETVRLLSEHLTR